MTFLEAMLDQVASFSVEEDFRDVVKNYNKAVGTLLDVPEEPA